MINGSGFGAKIEIDIAHLFSESPARVIIATEKASELISGADAAGIAIQALGQSTEDGLTINGMEIDLSALESSHAFTFPHYFGIESKNG